MRRHPIASTSLLVLALAAAAAPAQGQTTAPSTSPAQRQQTNLPSGKAAELLPPEQQPAVVTADQVTHDRDLNTLTASGHVEVNQGGRTLLADNLSYNLKQDVIIATGSVSLTDTDGEVTFADYMELTGDMKQAVARGIRVLMIDDSRMAANTGRRIGGERTILQKGAYTACKPCAENPDTAPEWLIKANIITHDETTHLVEYHDAWMELFGFPAFYTPYISHSDPTVKRESGLLTAGIMNNNVLGTGIRVPYFQVIDEQQDITLAPMISSKQGEELGVLQRWQGANGVAKNEVSVANEPTGGVNGTATIGWHVNATATFDLDETWRAGYKIQRASDPYYLETYGYHPTMPYLTSEPFLEGFDNRNYASLVGYSFQNLSTAVPDNYNNNPLNRKQPFILPLATYNFSGEPGDFGSYWTMDSHTAAVTREEGTSSRRLNTLTAWHLPYAASDGELFNLTTSVRADGYNSNNVFPDSNKIVDAGRVIPQATLDWRYPFTRVGSYSSQTFTPILVGTASPYGGNSLKIPNEDSLDFELDDINIFSPSPSSGYDRVLTGPRVAYGGEYQINSRGMPATDVVFGQSYQLHPQSIFEQGSGLDNHLSDYVGRVNVSPSSDVNVSYSFRFDKDDFTIRRSEVGANLGPAPLNLQTSYVFLDKLNPTSPFDQRQQISSTLSSQMTQYWKSQIYTVQDLGVDAGPLQTGVRGIYEDECLRVVGDAGSRQTVVKTFRSGHYLMFQVVFKTITQLPVNVF